MSKIIASSNALWLLLESAKAGGWNKKNEIEISVTGHTLTIDGTVRTLDIEAKSDFSYSARYNQLNKLRKVLRDIDHQPVVIIFERSGINLCNIQF